MSEIRSTLKKFIEDEFIHDNTEIDGSVNLLDEEIVDSLGIFTLVSFIERTFGIQVDAEEVNLENFEDLESITRLVESKRT